MNSNQINKQPLKNLDLSKLGKTSYNKITSYFGLDSDYEDKHINFKRNQALDKNLKKFVEKSYQISDKCFLSFIPETYIQNVGYSPEEIYLRFTKISTMLLVEHWLFFNAFGIELNDEAKIRSALFSFLKRTFDDLIDSSDDPLNKRNEVRKIFYTGKTLCENPEYKLFAHFSRLIHQHVPKDDFKNFYNVLPTTSESQSIKPDNTSLEHLKKIEFYKARNSFFADSYVIINDLSNDFIEMRKLSAELFQCIDDMSDFKEDLDAGKPTYINQSPDPEKTLRGKYSEIYNSINNVASKPHLYLYLMEYFLEKGISHNYSSISHEK